MLEKSPFSWVSLCWMSLCWMSWRPDTASGTGREKDENKLNFIEIYESWTIESGKVAMPFGQKSIVRQTREYWILKGEVSLYHWPPVWLVCNQLYDNWQCFYLQNRLIQTSQTGGQWYSVTSPFSIPWTDICPTHCFVDTTMTLSSSQQPIRLFHLVNSKPWLSLEICG